jgi:hypothetical protein
MEHIVKRLKKFGFQVDKKRKYLNGYTFYFKKSFENIDNSKDSYYLTLTEDIKEEIIIIYHENDRALIKVDKETLGYCCIDKYFNNSNLYGNQKPSLKEKTYLIPKSKLQIYLV